MPKPMPMPKPVPCARSHWWGGKFLKLKPIARRNESPKVRFQGYAVCVNRGHAEAIGRKRYDGLDVPQTGGKEMAISLYKEEEAKRAIGK